jgi:membrane-bound lytic murein transglycosylase D
MHRRLAEAFACLLLAVPPAAAAADGGFPRPPELEADVRFWERIYSAVPTQAGLLHDDRRLGIVYEEIHFEPGLAPKERFARVEQAREHYRAILQHLASGEREDLSAEERRVLQLFPAGVDARTLKDAQDGIRFQLGQADRFREGLIRSGAWEGHVEATLKAQGLPAELSALPHVESSFNPLAYSKVGAAGMWQFMPSTGRRWLRVDNVVDERLDPYKSTVAAAQYLGLNYELLGTWPLALTAYNHGAGGMRRAKEQLGTDDIVRIIRDYDSRSFGFASRNFYVSFLAALEIDRHFRDFFGNIERAPPENSSTVRLGDYVPLKSIERLFGTSESTLKSLNIALRESVWRGERFVPRGFELRLPREVTEPERRLATLSDSERYAEQQREPYYKLRSGESLERAAQRLGVPLERLLAANGLAKGATVHAGMRLKLPPPALAATLPAIAAPVAPLPLAKPRYVVHEGDSLHTIARNTGTPAATLLLANGLRNEDDLFEGQHLVLNGEPPDLDPASPAASEVASVAATLAAADPVDSFVAGPLATELPLLVSLPLLAPPFGEQSPPLLAGIESAASADPTDYSVTNDSTSVEAMETLGQLAEWLELPVQRLRTLNGLSSGAALGLGRRIHLDFSRVSVPEFEARRIAWHHALQDEFFTHHRIAGTERHRLRAGESLWTLSHRGHEVPVWLLREYNPDVDFTTVRPGTEVLIPHVVPVGATGSEG